jgi:hypothetical protein
MTLGATMMVAMMILLTLAAVALIAALTLAMMVH